MNLLVIDTATESCSVALQVDGNFYHRFEICPQQHSQRLLPMVDEVLNEASLSISQLDYLGFGRGPGSFTGVRIATGMLQGLALGTDVPVVGISTLAAMAQQAIMEQDASQVAAAIDARMSEVYFGRFENRDGLAHLVEQEVVIPPQQAVEMLNMDGTSSVGTGWDAYEQLGQIRQESSEVSILYPDAKYMLPLAMEEIVQGNAVDVELIQPVYLRDKVTWKKLPGRE